MHGELAVFDMAGGYGGGSGGAHTRSQLARGGGEGGAPPHLAALSTPITLKIPRWD